MPRKGWQKFLLICRLLKHYTSLLTGVFNSTDVLFYIIVSVFFISLSIWRLDAERTYG